MKNNEKKKKEKSKIWKVLNVGKVWENLTEPEEDEIEDVENSDTNKFIEDLRNIQIKTGTIKPTENLSKNDKNKNYNKEKSNKEKNYKNRSNDYERE